MEKVAIMQNRLNKIIIFGLVLILLACNAMALADNATLLYGGAKMYFKFEENAFPYVDSVSAMNMLIKTAPDRVNSFVNTNMGYAQRFNYPGSGSTNDYLVTKSTDATTRLSRPVYSFWLNATSWTNGKPILMQLANAGSFGSGFYVDQRVSAGNKIRVVAYGTGLASDTYETAALSTNTKYHVFIWFDGDIHVAINGAISGAETVEGMSTINWNLSTNLNNLSIAAFNNGGAYSNITVDELYVGNFSIGSETIGVGIAKWLYNGGSPTSAQQYPFGMDTAPKAITLRNAYNNSAIQRFAVKIRGGNATDSMIASTKSFYPLDCNLNDFSGNQDLEALNSPMCTPDGKGYRLNQNSGLQTIRDKELYINTSNSFWLNIVFNTSRRFYDTNEHYMIALYNKTPNSFMIWRIYMRNTTGTPELRFRLYLGAGCDHNWGFSQNFVDGKYHDVYLDFNRSKIVFYFDGTYKAENSVTASCYSRLLALSNRKTAFNLSIGGLSPADVRYYYNGSMYNIMFGEKRPSGFTALTWSQYLHQHQNSSTILYGSNITTGNGSVYYPVNRTVNITAWNISGNTYFNRTIRNWNSSNNIQINAWRSIVVVDARMKINNIDISLFNVTIFNGTGKQFNRSNASTLTTFYVNPGIYTITGKANGSKFNGTRTLTAIGLAVNNFNLSIPFSQLNISARKFFANTSITTFTAIINSCSGMTCETESVPAVAGVARFYGGMNGSTTINNVTIIASGYDIGIDTINQVFASMNMTFFLTYPFNITITAKNRYSGSMIDVFSIFFKDLFSGQSWNRSTANGTLIFNGSVNRNFNLTLYGNVNYSIESIIRNVTASNDSYEFSAIPLTTLIMNFFNETNMLAVFNVWFKILAEGFSYQATTGNASNYKEVVGLPPGISEIIYGFNTTAFSQRTYFVNVPLESDGTNISMLVLSAPSSTLFERTVYDQNNIPYYGGYLELQRAYVGEDNSSFIYRTAQISKIDSQGNAYLNAILNTQAYRMRFLDSRLQLVDTKNSNYLVDVTGEIIVRTAEDIMQTYFDASKISTSLSYNNVTEYFVFDYTDPDGKASQCCLEYTYTYGANVTQKNICSYDNAATLSLFADMSQNGTYVANANCFINGNKVVLETDTETFFNMFSYKPFRFFGALIFILGTILAATIALSSSFIFGILLELFFIGILGASYLNVIPLVGIFVGAFTVIGIIIIYLVYRK